MKTPPQPIKYLSAQGLLEAQTELDLLLNVERGAVIERLGIAKEYGNLDENGEYQAARNEQAFIEGRIEELTVLVREAKIIQTPKNNLRVVVGSTVEVSSESGTDTYMIVGRAEADPAGGRISNESPLGKVLLGRRLNDAVTVVAPAGKFDYTITHIA